MSLPSPDREGADPRSAEHDPGLDPELLRRRRDRVLTCMALLLILAVSGFAVFRFFYTPQPTPVELEAIVQRAVRAEFPASVALAFRRLNELTIRAAGEARYEVTGRVDAILPNAAAQLYTFECAIEPDFKGVWHAVNVDVRPGY